MTAGSVLRHIVHLKNVTTVFIIKVIYKRKYTRLGKQKNRITIVDINNIIIIIIIIIIPPPMQTHRAGHGSKPFNKEIHLLLTTL